MSATPTHLSTHVLETALDYLTVSTRRHSVADRWAVHCLTLQSREARDGNKLGSFHLNQYQGQGCGRVRFGYSGDALLVQLSGQIADDEFRYFWPDHNAVTRVDIAVTFRTLETDLTYGERAYADATLYRQEHRRAALPTLIQNADGGSTLYIGKRSSTRFGRIYNKHAQSVAEKDLAAVERYQRCWRVELELHDVDAEAVGMMLYAPGDRFSKIRYYLSHYLTQHGIPTPYPAEQRALLPTGFRRRSDRESRLAWLRTSVRPTVDWLKSSCTAEELADVLGLPTRQTPESDVTTLQG